MTYGRAAPEVVRQATKEEMPTRLLALPLPHMNLTSHLVTPSMPLGPLCCLACSELYHHVGSSVSFCLPLLC